MKLKIQKKELYHTGKKPDKILPPSLKKSILVGMTESRQWSAHLSVGDPKIDHQHQELFQLITMLDNAIDAYHDADKTEQIISFLEHYVVEHFQDEESLMLDHHYDGYDIHKEEHDIFKARVVQLRHLYETNPSPTAATFYIRQIIDKLVNHIHQIDIGIAGLYEDTHEKST